MTKKTDNIDSEVFDFWRNRGERYVLPGNSSMYPEGWDPRPFMMLLSAGQKTVEYGCGFGRLAGLFPIDQYIGIDINPRALELARKKHPEHNFELIDFEKGLPDAEFYFSYAVFLHIEDEILPKILKALPETCKRFCIAEIMGREWRIPGQKEPPAFCREDHEYIDIMKDVGFQLTGKFSFPYLHYYRKHFVAPKYFDRLQTKKGQVPNTNIDFLLFYRD